MALAFSVMLALLAQQPVVLDFQFFRTRVQPIFLDKRPGYTRCVVCHSAGERVGFLQPLSPGATTWNEEQSRQNFEAVSRLVTPGEPLQSLLLMHPLEPTAGGDEFHTGGRQFASQSDPPFQTIVAWVRGETASTLDFQFFRTRVQPIFLDKRPGYTRCVVCHSAGERVGFLQPLSPGATTWNEEQSRQNFEAVSRLVTPGEPLQSLLLMHPLEPTAGGDEFHTGGRQFASQSDPPFQTIVAWVRGETAVGSVR